MRNAIFLCLLLSVACVPGTRTETPIAKNPIPYETRTPGSPEAAPTALPGLTESIVPSPTPFTYTIKAGDTLGQIAEKFNVDLDALQAINPDVNPNGMSVGETLKIPSDQKNGTGHATPTPVAFPAGPAACYPTADRGLWCFVLAHNDSPDPIENVTAQVTLLDGSGQQIRSQTALLPLDILPPNESLPLSVFFAPDVPSGARPQVQILTAISLDPTDPRYLAATVVNSSVQVDQSGYSAQVSGNVALRPPSGAASSVWVAAVAYDAAGNVVGVRRWESSGDLPFAFMISGIGGRIDRVEFSVEARP